ncbi:hypothetical protein HC928_09940 [bacterium]|nr:hypothetical protein [bacterium]
MASRIVLHLQLCEPPGPGWEWVGGGPPGVEGGAWYNRSTGESLRPALQNYQSHGPHWDYQKGRGRGSEKWRWYPDGRCERKPS